MDVLVASIIRTIAGATQALVAWIAVLLTGYGTWCRLIQGGAPVTTASVWGTLTEANYSGYAPVQATTFATPATDSTGNTYSNTAVMEFRNNGGGVGNNVTSSVLVSQITGSTQATGTVTTTGGVVSAPVIVLAGAGYLFPPLVTVLGGGTGAVITATIAGGVVTALNLVSGGTGYTAATIVIEPPLQIVGFFNFPTPRPLNVATDALPLISQINMV